MRNLYLNKRKLLHFAEIYRIRITMVMSISVSYIYSGLLHDSGGDRRIDSTLARSTHDTEVPILAPRLAP